MRTERRYQLEVECTITEMCAMKHIGTISHQDYSLYFSILVMALDKADALIKARAVIKKYYPAATYIAFTTIDPSI